MYGIVRMSHNIPAHNLQNVLTSHQTCNKSSNSQVQVQVQVHYPQVQVQVQVHLKWASPSPSPSPLPISQVQVQVQVQYGKNVPGSIFSIPVFQYPIPELILKYSWQVLT